MTIYDSSTILVGTIDARTLCGFMITPYDIMF